MKAGERTLQQILHSADQYVIPVFQRYYVWKEANWDQLWDDVALLLEHPEEKRRHFLGSVVCVPEPHQPGVVPAYQVIDGQQRLTTLSILLCAIRDAAAGLGWGELAAEVEENYLVHRFKKGRERYKVFPRLRDRGSFLALIDRKPDAAGQIAAAHVHLSRRIADAGLLESEDTLRTLFTALATRLDLVCITLEGENPYKIFRSLNSTGVDLDQGDLIRNHVFTAMPVADQDAFDDARWRPLERHFEAGGKLDGRLFAAFFRDVLMRAGSYVGEDAIYESFERAHPLPELKPDPLVADLERRAGHYDIIRGVRAHPSADADRAIRSLRALKVTTAYPLVLTLLDAQEGGTLSAADLVRCLRSVAGFVLRRYVCGDGSRAYSRWFPAACKVLGDAPLANLTAFLVGKGWPADEAFVPKFQRLNLYKRDYDRAVLEGVEMSLQAASEPVVLDKCWIEHVLPQTVGDDVDGKSWKDALGERWREAHAEWVHTPGNLTLVGSDYNIAMQNKAFAAKKPVLAASKVYLNQEFADPALTAWTEQTIRDRGTQIALLAVRVWPGPPVGDAGDGPDDGPDAKEVQDLLARTVELLGGAERTTRRGGFTYSHLADGRVIHLKYSKYHEREAAYWYGVRPTLPPDLDAAGCTHVVLVMGGEGFACLPAEVFKKYLKTAWVSSLPDSTVRHYHVRVTRPPDPAMVSGPDAPRVPIGEHVRAFG